MIVPYVDTDFLMALIKPDDWLKEPAEKILGKYRGDLWTSSVAIVEVLMVAGRFSLNLENVVVSIYEMVRVPDMPRYIPLAAARFIRVKGMRTFDAFHAASAGEDAIISSDRIFDKAGLRRIPLE